MGILNKIVNVDNAEGIGLCGMTDEFFCIYLNNLFIKEKRDILVLTSSLYEANKLFNSLSLYNKRTFLFPMDDFLTSESMAISPELKTTRLDTLNNLIESSPNIVIAHLNSFLRYLPSKDKYLEKIINLKIGDVYNRESLINDLTSIGYKRESIVTNTGELGVRGFVIDIFPIDFINPIRIEFFDDEIVSIRSFDAETQKSISVIENVKVYPNTEFLVKDDDFNERGLNQKWLPDYCEEVVNVASYLSNPIVFVKDYSQLRTSYEVLLNDIFEYQKFKDDNYFGNYMFGLDEVLPHKISYYNSIDDSFFSFDVCDICNFGVKTIGNFSGSVEAVNSFLEKQLMLKRTVVIYLNKNQILAFTKYVRHKYIITTDDDIYDYSINIVEKNMNEGFIYGNYVFLTAKELYGKRAEVRYKNKYKYTSKIKSLSNLEIGDYVVHSINGIGVYNGLKTLTKNGLKKDYLEILYASNDKLYIPVEKIELIGKYTGKEGVSPKISRLGSRDWEKIKIRIRNKVNDIAKKLLELYAERKLKKGFAFNKDNEMQLIFENEFEYTATRDQLKAIDAIKKDMELDLPMDRLLCGDVGYGKTEVAFRAMFKAVLSSKQVLYLCPTTILSKQQYENAKIRFKNFPVNISLINRFTSYKETKQIIEDLGNGKIDILFGTHRLLSDDIKPKDLGLLVIDEEQRFGVVHKEKIKQYKSNVDVLTLTATPIPRTLQMSLVGIRSLSLIETPPVDRYPVQTYVIEENPILIRDAIYKEMARGGQVFVLYNYVEKIENKKIQLQNLVPDARIVVAHGQLSKNELEDRMISFINREYDVMLCTTIIETGIDITNANTLIIYNADRFGLSQLYQIRGRVGRSNRIGYAYLMYTKDKVLNQTAIKRLKAIKEFTELGSGFSIASRDLAIRGAGDILGSEQAGFIDSVGIDLYLKILNEEIQRLQGIISKEEKNERVNNLLNVETHISDSYVEDGELKIEIHNLINKVDSLEKLQEVKYELEDRFGKLSENMLIYMHEEWFESLAKKLFINKVVQNTKFIELYFDESVSDKIDGENLLVSMISISENFSVQYKDNIIRIRLNLFGLDKHYIYYLTQLLNEINLYM